MNVKFLYGSSPQPTVLQAFQMLRCSPEILQYYSKLHSTRCLLFDQALKTFLFLYIDCLHGAGIADELAGHRENVLL